MEEYELARQVLISLVSGGTQRWTKSQREANKTILDKREGCIAERIHKTLKIAETGLILLGMLHSLEGLLPSDIRVTYPGQVAQLTRRNGPAGSTKQRRSHK